MCSLVPRVRERLRGTWGLNWLKNLAPKRQEGFDRTRKSLHADQPAVITGLNDAVKTFILMSYEHRV